MTYSVAIKRDFVAQHFLIGGDWGEENENHSHHYVVELIVQGDSLDQHGYLVDIVELDSHLDAIVERYKDQTLNDLPEFSGLNPSIEHFARIICQNIQRSLHHSPHVLSLSVKIWENDIAWACYHAEVASD